MAKKSKLPVEGLKSTKAVPVRIVNDEPRETKSHEASERKWKAEEALRTMKEYAKIKSDKTLMSDAKKLAKDEMKKLKKVAGC